MGYPFILPGTIGGRNISVTPASLELYVRWMQLATFLPSMEFSVPPWDYEQLSTEQFNFSITEHAKKLSELHASIVNTYIYKLAEDSSKNGYPIIRPLWWIAPNDEQAVYTNDQFLIGDDVMVAPIITPDTTKRKVYFPEGTWTSCSPPHTRYNHQSSINVTLTTILWFEKSSPCKCCALSNHW